MPRRYPPLTPSDVRSILKAAGFRLARTSVSHEQWEHEGVKGHRRLVTLDTGHTQFNKDLIATMIAQSGLSRDEFYCQTQATARKINKRPRGTA